MSQSNHKKNKPVKKVVGKWSWKKSRPFVFFLGGFAVLMILFYVFYLSSFFEKHISPGIESMYAFFGSVILNLIGQATTANGIVISSSTFSISVNTGCDAIEAMALFCSAVLSFPMKWKSKIKALVSGVLILFVLNLIRIVSLFLTGVYAPGAFEIMHVEVWQALFIIFSLALWLFWIRRSEKKPAHVQN